MKDFILDDEEKELLEEMENTEWQSVENLQEEKKRLAESAKYTKLLKEKTTLKL